VYSADTLGTSERLEHMVGNHLVLHAAETGAPANRSRWHRRRISKWLTSLMNGKITVRKNQIN